MMGRWHTLEDRQSAVLTTRLRDRARVQGFPTDYSRIGWTTFIAVNCTGAQWCAILAECGIPRPR